MVEDECSHQRGREMWFYDMVFEHGVLRWCQQRQLMMGLCIA